MIIDCGACAVRGAACADCVVTFLTIGVRGGGDTVPTAGLVRSVAGAPVDLDAAECAAIDVLASSGLVPPLRLTPGSPTERSRTQPGRTQPGPTPRRSRAL